MPRPEIIERDAVYSVADVCEIFHCDQRLVRKAIERGELRAFLPNGCSRGLRILGQWVVEWMESGTAQGDES